MSKLAPHAPEIFQRLSDGESKASIARSLEVPASTLKDYISNYDAIDSNLPDYPPEEYVEIPVFERDYSHLSELSVYPAGDLHLGAQSHAADCWADWLNYLVEQEDCSFLGTGDFLDAALKNSKSESYDQTMTVGTAKRLFQKQIAPLADADRIDILIKGNHEDRIYRAVGDCPILDVADNLGVNYSDSSALLVYKVGNQIYDIYVRHGTGSANSGIGSRANQLQKQAHVAYADVYVSGHTHSQLVSVDNVFVREEGRMIRKRRLYISSGSFMAYERYASERAYVPGKLGAPRIILDGQTHDAHARI